MIPIHNNYIKKRCDGRWALTFASGGYVTFAGRGPFVP